MTERERLINDLISILSNRQDYEQIPYETRVKIADKLSTYILADRSRILEPLVKLKENIKPNTDGIENTIALVRACNEVLKFNRA